MTAHDEWSEFDNRVKNKKRAIVVLQVLFALGTIACGTANLVMNSRDIGFTYTETVAKKETNSYDQFQNNDNSAKITDPPPMVYNRKFFVEKLCWDNSAIWGGAIVLLAVIGTCHRVKSDCCAVTQSVTWVIGFLICITTGLVATFWSDQAVNNATSLKWKYSDKFGSYRSYRYRNGDDSEPTYELEAESSMNLANLVAVATIATAVLSYMNVILFLAPFVLDGMKGLHKPVARPRMWHSFAPFPCGFQVVIGSFLCRAGSLSLAKDVNAEEPTSSKYAILNEETTNDKAALINETESTKSV